MKLSPTKLAKVAIVWHERRISDKKGEVRQRYREGQEEQLGALGLVVNAIVLPIRCKFQLALHGSARVNYLNFHPFDQLLDGEGDYLPEEHEIEDQHPQG